MLRLSKKADYALIAMKHLALRGETGSSSAREIAEMYAIPIELMAMLLQRLARRRLLASHQGTRGGYQLARVPAAISVADVIQAIDGPVTVTACSTDDDGRSEEHTSELQSHSFISYAVFCLKKKTKNKRNSCKTRARVVSHDTATDTTD